MLKLKIQKNTANCEKLKKYINYQYLPKFEILVRLELLA